MSSVVIHEREQDEYEVERYSKRARLENDSQDTSEESSTGFGPDNSVLPPSHALLGIPKPVAKEGSALNFLEADVGISEYIGRGEAKVEGIIKQRYLILHHNSISLTQTQLRFTDFLVFEVDQDSNVIHLKNLGKPESSKGEKAAPKEPSPVPDTPDVVMSAPDAVPCVGEGETTGEGSSGDAMKTEETSQEKSGLKVSTKEEPWPDHFNNSLAPYLDENSITQLKQIYLEGPEPPRISDGGWAGRIPGSSAGDAPASEPVPEANSVEEKGGRDNRRGRGGRRGGRGGGRGGRGGGREDTRKVVSNVSKSLS